jgi:hypothetical protein
MVFSSIVHRVPPETSFTPIMSILMSLLASRTFL